MKQLFSLFNKPSIKKLLPFPVSCSHGEYSMILSQHDDLSQPTDSLFQLSFKAIEQAYRTDLSQLCNRLQRPPYYPNIWPGEHYRLLAALVKVIRPKQIIEIGTATGLSALAMKEFLPENGKIATFDLFAWQDDPNTHFTNEDFSDGRIVQFVEDLSPIEIFSKHQNMIKQTELIIIDATHDGSLEKKLLDLFSHSFFQNTCYLFFDDIRVWSMLKMWREIALPKLDLTSFGHWSGSGLVEIKKTK